MYKDDAGAGLPSDADLRRGRIARQPEALPALYDRCCRRAYSLALGGDQPALADNRVDECAGSPRR